MKNVLMIAYEFPPLNCSGTARPAGFGQYLSEFNYNPTVLTREGTHGKSMDTEMLARVEKKCRIIRIVPGDHDDWKGLIKQYFGWVDSILRISGMGDHRFTEGLTWRTDIYLPGLREYIHWIFPAVRKGLKLLNHGAFDLLWVTAMPWSSVMVGYWLSRLSGLPLIIDIRDPWTYGAMWHPTCSSVASWYKKWERKIISYADRTVFTSPLTAAIYRKKFSAKTASRIVYITNGYDNYDGSLQPKKTCKKCMFRFVGNVAIYRNPACLIEGIKRAARRIGCDNLALQFVGGLYSKYESLIDKDLVSHLTMVSQSESRQLMREADVLVLLQADTNDGSDVISGKAYEYLASGKPILGVVPENGGDAWLIRETGAGLVVGTNDPQKIADGILYYYRLWQENKLISPVKPEILEKFHRRNLTRQLANLFDEVLCERGSHGR
jgi:glycosyltransferase involved in cell wall biosynthesis